MSAQISIHSVTGIKASFGQDPKGTFGWASIEIDHVFCGKEKFCITLFGDDRTKIQELVVALNSVRLAAQPEKEEEDGLEVQDA
jgi:hypothetical protein